MASAQGQPQPAYILRGHSSQIHSTSFIRSNSRLVTGDTEGWIVVWSLAIKRPVAVWKAHEGSILGAKAWGIDKLITHGKDNKLVVWKLSEVDEESMSSVLPVDTAPEPRKQPWILHIVDVNTMNFCSFAWTPASPSLSSEHDSSEEILVAVPNIMTSETVDIFHLPSSKRIHRIPQDSSFKGGMIMAVSIFHHPQTTLLTIIAGYESGHTTVSQLPSSSTSIWQTLYTSQPHTQPVLSLDSSPSKDFYLTSSADAIIAKHPIPFSSQNVIQATENKPLKTIQTKHSGQQGLQIRNDGKIFATAGWDAKVRVYATKSMKELAVLKWHKEGCYAITFADVHETVEEVGKGSELAKKIGTMSVKEERLWKAKTGHWVAVGSKDGKVSLWDIY
ncbi:ASTRA-associated protein [Lachnellula hyalina]|uniref:ASTRA-associated protein 1 n=1 Tax=Lachnellula hyalina TaxID=1316788 RepID=A0A8H8QYY0_9HELO|nr:ASTRA-associated protein [Lachnellula hyalina]TVY25442.1 ASTRA-associated protein [Lachnellula hyalina]